MIPYETEQLIQVTDESLLYPVPFPGRCLLNRVAVVKVDGTGQADFIVYNRAFTSDEIPIDRIEDDGNGFCRVVVVGTFLPVRVGDVVELSNTGVAEYESYYSVGDSETAWPLHRITALVDDHRTSTRSVTLNLAFTTAVDRTGTIQLAIPSAEQPLYEVDSATGVDFAEVFVNAAFVNLDPLANRNIGVNRKMYIKFSKTGTFKLTARGHDTTQVSI